MAGGVGAVPAGVRAAVFLDRDRDGGRSADRLDTRARAFRRQCPSWRDSRRAGYIGILLTFGLPWAMIAVALAAGAWWSWLVLAAAAILRAAVCVQVGVQVLHDSATVRRLALVPLRDLIAFWVWFASFAGHEVHWRGDVFILKDGKIRPAHHHAPVMVSAAEPEQDKVSVHS